MQRLFGRRVLRLTLRGFEAAEKPAAWVMAFGGAATFVSVLIGLIAQGEVRTVTLIAAADLTVSGFSALRDAYGEALDDDAPAEEAELGDDASTEKPRP